MTQAKLNTARTDPDNAGPLCNGHTSPIVFNNSVTRLVVRLNDSFNPSAVARLIALAIVNAVNFVVVRWSMPHIGKERFEAVRPSLAHRNAFCAVVLVCLFVFVVAAAFHPGPHFIFGSAGQPVGSVFETGQLIAKAATTEAFACCDAAGENLSLLSAITSAKPITLANVSNNYPSADAGADKVFAVRRNGNKILVSHNVTSVEGCDWSEPAGVSAPRLARSHFTNFNGGPLCS